MSHLDEKVNRFVAKWLRAVLLIVASACGLLVAFCMWVLFIRLTLRFV